MMGGDPNKANVTENEYCGFSLETEMVSILPPIFAFFSILYKHPETAAAKPVATAASSSDSDSDAPAPKAKPKPSNDRIHRRRKSPHL